MFIPKSTFPASTPNRPHHVHQFQPPLPISHIDSGYIMPKIRIASSHASLYPYYYNVFATLPSRMWIWKWLKLGLKEKILYLHHIRKRKTRMIFQISLSLATLNATTRLLVKYIIMNLKRYLFNGINIHNGNTPQDCNTPTIAADGTLLPQHEWWSEINHAI